MVSTTAHKNFLTINNAMLLLHDINCTDSAAFSMTIFCSLTITLSLRGSHHKSTYGDVTRFI